MIEPILGPIAVRVRTFWAPPAWSSSRGPELALASIRAAHEKASRTLSDKRPRAILGIWHIFEFSWWTTMKSCVWA
jgi:hypothetical protein